MSLKQLKKVDLLDLAKDLGLGDIDGTKAVIEDKINDHFNKNPALEKNPKFAKYYTYRKKFSSPVKTPSKARESLASPIKKLGTTEEDSESEDEKVEGSDSGEEDSDDVEVEIELSEKADSDSSDAEDFVAKYKELALEKLEGFKSSTVEHYHATQEYVADKNASLKEFLSDPAVYLNGELIFELLIIVYSNVPKLEVKDYLPAAALKYVPDAVQNCPVWDFKTFVSYNFLSLIVTWFTISLAIPGIAGYYLNFSKFDNFSDPFTFYVTRGFLNYVFLTKAVSLKDLKNDVNVTASLKGMPVSVTYAQIVSDFFFRNSLVLRNNLGLVPFFGISAGILLSLYVSINA